MTVATTRVLVVAALCATACQPWYRDQENRARRAHDDARTERELAEANADHARGRDAHAAELLRDLVERCPETDSGTWVLLGLVEAGAGRAAEGRAYVRWRLSHLAESDPGAAALRAFLIASFVADGRIAPALDLVQPQTLDGALAAAPLAGPLRELARAVDLARTDPDAALARVTAWLDAYGEPDHAILAAAREAIAQALWDAAAAPPPGTPLASLRHFGPLAREELRAGHVATALALYAQAARLWPAAELAPYRAEMERAAVGVDPSALDPDAHALAVEGDAMLRDGKLGPAIERYRRAVASAPWWDRARRNLAAMLAVDR